MKITSHLTVLLIIIYNIHGYKVTDISTDDDTKNPEYFKHATKSRYFVDKTNLLKDFLHHESFQFSLYKEYAFDNETRAMAFTCPKGFGKTTNLDMVRRFFQLTYNKSTGQIIDKKTTHYYKLFTDKSLNLAITQNETFIEQHFGEYPTIYLDFLNINGTTTDEIINSAKKQIGRVLNTYRWLCIKTRKENENSTDQRLQQHLSYFKKMFKKTANATDAVYALEGLAEILSKNSNKTRVMVLIDNFDTPITHIMSNNIYVKPVYDFMNFLLEKFIQYERASCHVMAVGTSHVAFVNWQVDDYILFDRRIYSIQRNFFLQNYYYTEFPLYFGFTYQEVNGLLTMNNDDEDEIEKMKNHLTNCKIYFKGLLIYSPICILRFLENEETDDDRLSTTGLLMPQIMKCLRHKEFFDRIIEYMTGINCNLNTVEIKSYTLHELADITINNCSKEIYYEYPYEYFSAILLDNGNLYRGKHGSIQLKRDLNRFIFESYGINVTNSYTTRSIQSILNSNDTTDEMLINLGDSLQKMITSKRTELLNKFQFQSVIFITLFNFWDFKERTRLGKMTSYEKFDQQIDRFMIQNRVEKIALIVQVCYNETLEKTIKISKKYVPFKWPLVNKNFHLVKYLAITLNKKGEIQVGKSRNRKFPHFDLNFY